MNTQEVYEKLKPIKSSIQARLMKTEYGRLQIVDPADVEIQDRADPNEMQLHDELYNIVGKLDDCVQLLEYLEKPVSGIGVLTKNEDGRYELPDGKYFTSGSQIEVLVTEDEETRWVLTVMEHDGTDYYLMYRHLSPMGQTVRYRRSAY